MENILVTLVGSTCSGKTTLKDQLLATGKYIEIISHTTRPMRTGEVDGETYHYVSQEVFDKMDMLERVSYNGNSYGGSAIEFEKAFNSGLIPIIIVEPNGNKQININARKKGWKVANVWVGCPVELQAERLILRLMDDYRHVMANGGTVEFTKLMKEYVGRFTMIQTVESEWFDLFRSSIHVGEAAPLHYVKTFIPRVVYIPSFTKETESKERERVETMIELYGNDNG